MLKRLKNLIYSNIDLINYVLGIIFILSVSCALVSREYDKLFLENITKETFEVTK